MKTSPIQQTLNGIFFNLLWTRFFAPLLISSLAIMTSLVFMAGQEYQEQQETINNSVTYSVSSYLYNASNVLDMLAIRAQGADMEQVIYSMEGMRRGYEYFDALYYLDEHGRVLAVAPADDETLGLDLSLQEYFQGALATNGAYISRPFISMKSGHPAVYLAKSVPGRGVVAGELSLNELQRIIGLGMNMHETTVTFITDQWGTLLAHPRVELVAQQENAGKMELLQKARHGDLSLVYWEDGGFYTGSAALEQTSGWIVISQARVSDVFRPYIVPALLYVVISVGVLALFLRLFSGRFRHVVIEPLRQLSRATSEVAEGSFSADTRLADPTVSFQELDHLSRNFHKMTESVLARENMLQHLATHDPLTDLPNRTMFKHQLEAMVRKAPAPSAPSTAHSAERTTGTASIEASTEQDFAVLFIDLDDFKTVNDAFGHHTGDLILRTVSRLLSECIGDAGTVGRLGGDEFGVLLQHPRAVQNAGLIAEELLRRLTQSMNIDGHEIYLSASIGISVYPLDGQNPDELVQNADTAMYQAKGEGKNSYLYYSLEMETRAQERHRLTTLLHHALELDEFELVYQPIYATRTRQMVCSEALIRWHSPRMGDVPPSRFIPLANETGLILPLGEWVLRAACQQNQQWLRQCCLGQNGQRLPYPANLRVSVNVSERQLRHKDFVETVRSALEATQLPPELLTLELNENIFFQGFKEIGSLLARVKQLGVRLALDDFGMGYATLSCLTQIPFDEIKIDRSLSMNIGTSAGDAAIVRGILHIAHDLGMQVVGEGVETEEQIRFYEALGCDLLQGYYFSKPLRRAEFEERLSREMQAQDATE